MNNYSADQVINGLIKYADNEIMVKLPTTGKWIFGTVVNLASNKVNDIVCSIQKNPIASALGIVDDGGLIDVDSLLEAMKTSADKYGVVSVDIPMIGSMNFSKSDIEALRSYIV